MPIYEYECPVCKDKEEQIETINSKKKYICLPCEKEMIKVPTLSASTPEKWKV